MPSRQSLWTLLTASALAIPLDAGAALVSHWSFEGDYSDLVGGNNGVAAGPAGSFQAGWSGQGWHSGGQGSVVQVADANSLDVSQYTIEAWVKLDAVNYYNMAFFWKGQSGGQDISSPYSLAIRGGFDGANGGKLLTTVSDGSTSQYFIGNTALGVGSFHHVAVTVDGAYVRMYLDGVLDGQFAQTVTPYANSTDLQIGSMLNVPILNALNGTLDELKFYNEALSAAQIAADAGLGVPEPTPLLLISASLAALLARRKSLLV